MLSESRKLRIVIDTNVFISGLNFAGKPSQILDLFIEEEMEVLVSPFILSELERVLRDKFGWEEERVTRVLNLIKAKAIEIQPRHRLSVIKEKDADNRILECAVEGEADYIISGDKRHILPLKEYLGIMILSPDDFLGFWRSQLLE